jgi:FtsH-binding integral membrane protein
MRGLATDTIAPTVDDRSYFRDVFAWMFVALAVTGAVAAAIGHSQTALHAVFVGSGRLVFIVCLLLEFVLVAGLVGLVQHMGLYEAATTFIAYSALNGVTLSFIFAAYTTKSIYATLFVAAAMFGVLALAGYTTSLDLTGLGTFLLMALVGQVIGLVVNIVWFNDTLYWATTVTGVLIFSGLTAYDVQRLKRYEVQDGGEAAVEKSAIVGALALYLDFVNLFLYLLRILGRRR